MASAGLLTYIDPFDSVIISYNGKKFGNKLNKKSFIGSRVSYSDVILHSFKVSESINDEELKTIVEIKMYEDAGLELQKKYKIIYVRKELDFEDSVLIEAFAIEVQRATEALSAVLKQTRYIDFLALPFLSFSTLYKNEIIEPKNDLFVYIDKEEAFLSIYKDGKYLSTKSLMNLEEMVKKLDSVGIEITIDELKEHLYTKGLDATLYERGETALFSELESIFSAMFTKINDIVVYNRSVFGFEKVDRIFFSTQNGRLKGAREFIQNFDVGDIEVRDFNVFKNKEEGNFFEKIVTSYIYDSIKEEDSTYNLTIFKRELAFYKKESGRVLTVAFLIIFSSLSFVGYLWFQNSSLQNKKDRFQEEYDNIKKSEASYKKKIKETKGGLKAVTQKKQNIQKRIKNIDISMTQLERIISAKRGYSSFIFDVNKLLQKHKLSTTKISIVGKRNMSINIIAKYKKRDSITKFMEDLISSNFIGITTDEIRLDKDIYISKIEIKR